MTSGVALNDLISSYQNEKCTESLLPYNQTCVDHFLNLIAEQVKLIDLLETSVVKNIYELEVERVKYFIKEYIQTRLKKLHSNLYLDRSLLSKGELQLYKNYIEVLKERDIYVEEVPGQKGNEFVGFYCLVDINSIKIDGDVLEMFKGDFFIAPLYDVIELLKRNEIILF